MIQDNTAKWKVKKLSSLNTSSGIPVGFEYISMNPNVPQGSLPMFGGVYDRKVYADLWAWVQTQSGYVIPDNEWQGLFNSNDGNVPFYSTGDGSTTFRVPSISCWVKGANGIEEVSSYYTDTVNKNTITMSSGSHTHTRGTMNITGTLVNHGTVNNTDSFGLHYTFASNSALYADGSVSNGFNHAGGYGGNLQNIQFDASRNWTGETSSNGVHTHTIDGGDETRPKTVVGMWLVKAYGTISNVGNVETADILNAVENSRIALRVW